MEMQNNFQLEADHQRHLESLLANNIAAHTDDLSSEYAYGAICPHSCKGGCSCENGGTMTIG